MPIKSARDSWERKLTAVVMHKRQKWNDASCDVVALDVLGQDLDKVQGGARAAGAYTQFLGGLSRLAVCAPRHGEVATRRN